MSLNQEEKGKQIVAYSPDDTFEALSKVLHHQASKFTIKKSNKLAHTFLVRSGVSMKSWGETLQITVNPIQSGASEILISSQSKFGLLDYGKNQENVNSIMTSLSNELSNGDYQNLNLSNNESIPDQIKKLSELKDSGILTPEEFENKKSELLARM